MLYVREAYGDEPRVLLDPNSLSADGTVAVSNWAVSEDGDLLGPRALPCVPGDAARPIHGRYPAARTAYGLSEGGSDWQTVRVKRVGDGTTLDDCLRHVKFSSLAWTHDHRGFFYSRYPEPTLRADGTETEANVHHMLWYHVLGTPQSSDVMCFDVPEQPKWLLSAEVTADGRCVAARAGLAMAVPDAPPVPDGGGLPVC